MSSQAPGQMRPDAASKPVESKPNRNAQAVKGASLPTPKVPYSHPAQPKSILQTSSHSPMQSPSNSHSSSPGVSSSSSPNTGRVALPPAVAVPSKSDSAITGPAMSSPLVEVTPPLHERIIRSGRPRGHSTSTVRPSPAGSVIHLLEVEAPPMSRVVSNPLPQPPATQSLGTGRGRTISLTPRDRSAASSRDPSTDSRGRHRIKDLAKSWSTFRSGSSSSLPPAAGPSSTRANTTGADDGRDDEKKYWWHSQTGPPRSWGDSGSPNEATKEDYPPATQPSHDTVSVEALKDVEPLSRRGSAIPVEQTENWRRTKEKVADAAKAVLGYTLDITHEGLEIGAEVLEFAPIPGLAQAARVLLGIWDAVQMVDLNRLGCLRLTERCATILLSVKQEIDEADGKRPLSPPHVSPQGTSSRDSPRIEDTSRLNNEGTNTPLGPVGDELKAPLERLVAAFSQVLQVLERQNRRPFLKRYLKRDEIIRELAGCDQSLNDALGMFNISIQVRILKQVLLTEERRMADTAILVDHILHTPPVGYSQLPPPQYSSPPSSPRNPARERPLSASPDTQQGAGLLLEGVPSPDAASLQPLGFTAPTTSGRLAHVHDSVLPPPFIPSTIPTTQPQVSDTLAQVLEWQNTRDNMHDTADLRQLLREAIQTHDDQRVISLMQVRPDEAPEALKALRRALEEEQVREERDRFDSVPEDTSVSLSQSISIGSTQGILDGVLGDKGKTTESTFTPVKKPTADSFDSNASSGHSRSSTASHDTLHREFMETGIESLVRLSLASGKEPTALSLPSWTITRYEVDRDERIGVGFFSEVWKGRYRGRTVAVKVLAPWTPKDMFLREAKVWDELRHENILEMVGASAVEPDQASAHGWNIPDEHDAMPWFFVSRYYQRGNLVKWVKGLDKETWNNMLDDPSKGVLRMIHEMVLGMEYLHTHGILHGDFKCANVLINDYGHCIISDFGQSELKSEAYRISGTPLPHGTLRWQAPELMQGSSKLTRKMDVYAFAMACVELLTKGGVPWPLADDDAVRHFVLRENKRPELPTLRTWSPHLTEIIGQCWARIPESRPKFTLLNREFVTLRMRFGWNGSNLPEPGEADDEHDWIRWIDEIDQERTSPKMTPRPLPLSLHDITEVDIPSFDSGDTFVTAPRSPNTSTSSNSIPPLTKPTVSAPVTNPAASIPAGIPPHGASEPGAVHSPQPSRAPTRETSLTFSSSDGEQFIDIPASSSSPQPVDQIASDFRDERRYRMVLEHEFNHSLTLPLWTPSVVKIGAVGYHEKPSGTFVTLFNAFEPLSSSGGKVSMPSLRVYGKVNVSNQKIDRLEKRSTARKGIEFLQNLLSRGKEDSTERAVSRRYSAPLRNGHKAASLFTESTIYRYVSDADLAAPKGWFHSHIDTILDAFGKDHQLQREDVMLVIGTLEAADYALFVSHSHPDGQVNFNVFASSKIGQPWGEFSTTTATDLSASAMSGPVYHEEMPRVQANSKVSRVRKASEPWDTVLVARLRFAPDREEPTVL